MAAPRDDRPRRERPLALQDGVAWQAGDQLVVAATDLLTHPIVVRGPADSAVTGDGGHVMAMAGSTLRIESVELAGLGQAGAIGRYPVHFHMNGDAPTSYVLGLGIEPPAVQDRLTESDASPATFWISNPSNIYVGNVAAGATGQGFWYDLADAGSGLSADVEVDPSRAPMGVFDGNTAHSNASVGFETGMGLFVDDYRPEELAHFTDFTGWKNEGFGVWLEHGVRLDGAVLADNRVGLLARDAVIRDALVVGRTTNAADRPWQTFGIGLYSNRGDVADVDLVNFRSGDRETAAVHFVDSSTRVPTDLADLRFVNAGGLHWWGATEVTLPWSGPAPYVYRHWDHDTPLAAAPAGQPLSDQLRWSAGEGAVTLRLTLDEKTDWTALDVCAEAGCPEHT